MHKWFNENVDLRIVKQPYRNSMSTLQRLASFTGFYIKGWLSSLSVQDVDLIYASSTPLSVALLGKHLAHFLRVPLYLELRDLWPDFPVEMGAIRNKKFIKRLYTIEKELYSAANHIITLSPTATQRLIHNKEVEAEKISTFPNGTTYPFFRPRKTKRQLIGPTSRKLVLYGGTLGKANNIEWLINFINHALWLDKKRNFHFAILGSGSERKKIVRWYRNMPVSRKSFVQLSPEVSRVEAANWFIAADFSLITYQPLKSLKATSPNKFFDSLSGGAIPITNHTGWVGQLVKSWNLGIAQSSPRMAAERMLALQQNESLKNTYHRNSLNAAKQFRRDEMASKLYEMMVQDLND